MTNEQIKKNQSSILKARIIDANIDGYDNWAANYDREVKGINYQSPYIVAQKLLNYISIGSLLDIGCGTGLSGEAVQQQPNDLIIDGCDYSQGMLDIAASQNLYRSLIHYNINNLPFENLSYDSE